jgi:hypothetical protein
MRSIQIAVCASLLLSKCMGFQLKHVDAKSQRASSTRASEADEDLVDWKICDSAVHSNLAGLGPDSGASGIRMSSITTENGEDVDLLITSQSDYTPNDVSKNGRNDCFGVLNVDTDSSVELLFRFVKAGTDTPVTLSNFFFSVYDVDQFKRDLSKEYVVFPDPIEGYRLDGNSELETSGTPGRDLKFRSTQYGNGVDNPRDPLELTDLQKERTVTVQMKDTNQFRMTFGVEKDDRWRAKGRNFLFAGRSSLPKDDEQCSSCDIWADPHLSGFDNSKPGPLSLPMTHMKRPLDVNLYDSGFFWLVRSDQVSIQGHFRTTERWPDQASVGAIAVSGSFMDGHKLVVHALDGDIRFDGKNDFDETNFEHNTSKGVVRVSRWETGNGNSVDVPAAYVLLELPLGMRIKIGRYDQHLDAKITMRRISTGQDGECGNFNGNAEDDHEEQIQERMGNLEVAESDRLF